MKEEHSRYPRDSPIIILPLHDAISKLSHEHRRHVRNPSIKTLCSHFSFSFAEHTMAAITWDLSNSRFQFLAGSFLAYHSKAALGVFL